VTSEVGKLLGRRRSELVERGFQHVLDCGAARRTTLRGRENIRKRYLIRAMGANLSLLMRHMTGVGTPKQALAAPEKLLGALLARLSAALHAIKRIIAPRGTARRQSLTWSRCLALNPCSVAV
jgi:hypothetical protein